ncbi:MAG: VWA domain-containing protein, partial [Spirochaetaceae bacterium]|nr:VWA domain-containing protein [Spirochaetaceae bacterium]
MKLKIFLAVLAVFPFRGVYAQDLSINLEDLRIEQRTDGGFHLFIRKKAGIASVLITESTRDPSLNADNYAYRALEWNEVNGDEIRLLNGVPIPKENGIWSLIDSSPEPDAQFGEAFHIYIPHILEYGYSWTRSSEIYVVDGTYLNMRAFALPYGDYRGPFADNPFTVRVVQRPQEGPPEGNFMRDTVEAFTEIAATGKLAWSTGPDDLVDTIKSILEDSGGDTLDLVLCLDTTSSMTDDIDSVRLMLIPMLRDIISKYSRFRIGMVLYKDYFEEYLNRVVPFTGNFDQFQRDLNAITVAG